MSVPSWAPAVLRSVWEERDKALTAPPELMTILHRYPAWKLSSAIRPDRREESVKLLERLLTDLRMKTVWEKLAARAGDNFYDVRLYLELQRCAVDWESEPKDSAAEKRKHLESICDRRDHWPMPLLPPSICPRR